MRLLSSSIAAWVVLCLVASVYGQEKPQVPKDALAVMEYLEGTWQFQARIGDRKESGTFSARWARGRHCLITQDSAKSAGEPAAALGTGVLGWDPAKKRITHCGFGTDGSFFLNRWEVAASGDWVGQVSGVRDGKEFSADFKITKSGADKFVFESKTPSGEAIEAVYTKVRREERKKAENK